MQFSVVVIITGGMGWLGYQHRRQNTLDAALFDAATLNKAEKVHTLLSQGANPNLKWRENQPIDLLGYYKQLFGTDPRQSDTGRTALMMAAHDGKLAVARELLNARANIDIRDGEGHTALYWAACGSGQDSGAILFLLAKHGADLRIKTADGKTLWDLARENPKTMRALQQASAGRGSVSAGRRSKQ